MYLKKIIVWLSMFFILWTSVDQFKEINTTNTDERLVVVFVNSNKSYLTDTYEGRAGSVDVLKENAGNLDFGGWISPDIDEIHVIVSPESSHFVQRLQLLPRPDVQTGMGNDSYLYSGFETVLPQTTLVNVVCVVFANKQGSKVSYANGNLC